MEINTIEMMEVFDTYEEKSVKTVNNIKNEFLSIRAGRANPHILDKVLVDYYGTPTPINQMGNVTISEARVLVVSVWDASALKDVEKAIILTTTVKLFVWFSLNSRKNAVNKSLKKFVKWRKTLKLLLDLIEEMQMTQLKSIKKIA